MRCSRNSGWPIRTPRQIWNCVGLVVGFRLQMNLTRVHTVFESMIHDIDLAVWYKGSRVKSVRAYERSVSGADAPGVCGLAWSCGTTFSRSCEATGWFLMKLALT
jgi:hypothetical protein